MTTINTFEQSPGHQRLNKGHCYYYCLCSISIWTIPITLQITCFCLSPVIRHPRKENIWLSSFCTKLGGGGGDSVTGLNPRGAGVRIQTVLVTAGIIRQTSADDGNVIGKGKVHRLFSSTFVTLGSLVSLMGRGAHCITLVKISTNGFQERLGLLLCFNKQKTLFITFLLADMFLIEHTHDRRGTTAKRILPVC